MKLNLAEALDNVGEYVLIRRSSDFPEWIPGSDVDLLTLDRGESLIELQRYLASQIDGESEYLRVTESPTHTHADIMRRAELLIRFDLIDDFDYPNFSVMPSFKTFVFMNRRAENIGGFDVFVPSESDELLIRYFEYLAWFEQRPDKIKHLEYILSSDRPEAVAAMEENAHRFVRYQHKTWNGRVGVRAPFLLKIVDVLRRLIVRSDLLRRMVGRVYRVFRRLKSWLTGP